MASNRGGVNRVLKKLDKCLNEGNFYEAHQLYRTLHFRYVAQNKYAEAIDLLYNGSLKLMQYNQQPSGADLALLLVDVLKRSELEIEPWHIDKIGEVHRRLDPQLVERSQLAANAISCMKRKHMPSGHPLMHQRFAVTFWRERCWATAHYHFIHSTDGEGTAVMLVDHHLTAGYPSEVDLFIAQAVFQFLCLKKILSANKCFEKYTTQHPHVEPGPPFVRPLLNFLWLLLLAVEGGKLAMFTVLVEQYQSSLQRDPTYRDYLDRIGQLFFGVPAPQNQHGAGGGLLGNLLQTLFTEEDDAEPVIPLSEIPEMATAATEDLD